LLALLDPWLDTITGSQCTLLNPISARRTDGRDTLYQRGNAVYAARYETKRRR
jgi:hypothetical protein